MGWQIIVVVAANMNRLEIFFWIFQQMSNKEGRRVNCFKVASPESYIAGHMIRGVSTTRHSFPTFFLQGFFFLNNLFQFYIMLKVNLVRLFFLPIYRYKSSILF